jgi:hypothetical protein
MNNKKAILFVPFYTPVSVERYEEMLCVLSKNASHDWLELIVLMIDDDTFATEQPPHDNILVYRTEGMPTYADWIALSSQYAVAADLSICANADIELADDFLENALRETRETKTLLCITRYELSDLGEPQIRVNPHWTQDTWCLTPQGVSEAAETLNNSLKIPFGTPRCDNRIPYVFWLRGWRLVNPCERVITLHHQKDSMRAYSKKDTTILGSVAFVYPSTSVAEASEIEIDIFSLSKIAPRKIKYNQYLAETSPADEASESESAHVVASQIKLTNSILLSGGRLVLIGTINLDEWNLYHHYNDRFKIYRRNGKVAFVDLGWPSLWIYDDPGFCDLDSEQIRLAFYWGFCTPVTELIPSHVSSTKLFSVQKNFWQYPCRTEQDAYERHVKIVKPSFSKNVVNTYVGLPWATWIDKRDLPFCLLHAFGNRFAAIRSFLADSGTILNVHTVCQHIYWKDDQCIKSFEQAGINQLWIAHKERGWDQQGQLRLHSWPLYAVNVLDPERREGLEFVPAAKKAIFASFKGAHMKHYLSDIRLKLRDLAHLDGYEIEVSDLWHFNKMVYNYQIANKEADKEAIEREEIRAYNQLLSQTLFSLCPGGAGPNTMRLWESLGTGSIPVVLSDRYEFPSLETMCPKIASWDEAIINVKESRLHKLDQLIRNLPNRRLEKMQLCGLEAFKCSQRITCFPDHSQ